MQKKLYMQVDLDNYELPLVVADSISELARMIGVNKSTIQRGIRLSKNSQYVEVILDDEDC